MNPSVPRQLGLAVTLRDDATFDNFTVGANGAVVASMQQLGQADGEPRLYIWGPPGAGRTHLLQATCHALTERGLRCVYVPLHERADLSPAMLEDLEHSDVVCIDDIDVVAGDASWEHAMFDFYNRAAVTGCALLMAASAAPSMLPWGLADLKSRLAASLVYRLEVLNDDAKMAALQQRAQRRGMELNDEAAGFLLRHVRRDTCHLFELLDRLDTASLAAQRRLTVPFIKQVLNA